MENVLYPLKFTPQFKERVWGGQRLRSLFNKNFDPLPNCGESWELSSLPGNVSVVSNGFLEGNNLAEIIEVYMGDLVGETVYEKHGNNFPLLFKLLDTVGDLSIQVHPDDAVARIRHQSNGKNEMWYVIHAEADAEIIAGFKKDVAKEEYLFHLGNNKLKELLNVYNVEQGDVFYIPAGQVHAIGSGIALCEIQQSSDITYRLYDWDRPGSDGKPRKLHVEEALDVIDFKAKDNRVSYESQPNEAVKLASSPYFTTNLLDFNIIRELDYFFVDSFVVYICMDGACRIEFPGGEEFLKKGETILLPASIKNLALLPEGQCRLLETYII